MLLTRLTPALVAGLALAAPATAQDRDEAQPDPGFSIMAPAAEASSDAEPEAAAQDTVSLPTGVRPLPTGPAPADTAPDPSNQEPIEAPALVGSPPVGGAHLDRSSYLEARGIRDASILTTRWQIERSALDGSPLDSETREIVLGDGYAFETGADGTVHDFDLNRILSRTQTLDGTVMRNRPVVTHVHRQMNTFAYFTQGGELDEVAGPGGALFERFWIEAAMGVRLSPVDLVTTVTDDGATEVRRAELGSVVFGFTPDPSTSGAAATLFISWLRHTLPIHPDALLALDETAGLPSTFEFIVFSPSSPDGRRERWTRIETISGHASYPWPSDITAASGSAYAQSSTALASLIDIGHAALKTPQPVNDAGFIAAADRLQAAGDLAGAYLALFQSSHVYGPCRAQTDRPSCARISQVAAAGLGNAEFQGLMNALSNMTNDRAAAIAGLRPHLDRPGPAGAAANLLAAQALATLRSTDPGADVDLQPIGLFSASAAADPHAAMTYWHAGRYAAARDDLDAAWLLFEIAAGLPSHPDLPPSREAAAMRSQLRSLAPQFFVAEAPR
ncbi:hypothetical protein [Maricaulis sp. CAU 1757]